MVFTAVFEFMLISGGKRPPVLLDEQSPLAARSARSARCATRSTNCCLLSWKGKKKTHECGERSHTEHGVRSGTARFSALQPRLHLFHHPLGAKIPTSERAECCPGFPPHFSLMAPRTQCSSVLQRGRDCSTVPQTPHALLQGRQPQSLTIPRQGGDDGQSQEGLQGQHCQQCALGAHSLSFVPRS